MSQHSTARRGTCAYSPQRYEFLAPGHVRSSHCLRETPTPQTGVEPVHCAPDAFRCFSDALPEVHTTNGLVRAAIAVSMHAFDDVVPEHVEGEIQNFALRVLAQCR